MKLWQGWHNTDLGRSYFHYGPCTVLSVFIMVPVLFEPYLNSLEEHGPVLSDIDLRYHHYILLVIIHQSIVYELLSNLIGSLLPYYDFILH